MKLLQLFHVLLMLMSITNIYAQEESDFLCDIGNDEPDYLSPPTHSLDLSDDFACGNTFRVHFYFLRDDEGNFGVDEELMISPDDLIDEIVLILNDGFQFSNLDPLSSPFEYISDINFTTTESKWEYLDHSGFLETTLMKGPNSVLNYQSRCDAINIYVKPTSAPRPGNSIGGAQDNPEELSTGYYIRIGNGSFSEPFSLTNQLHEMGHVFGLQHTFNRTAYFNPPADTIKFSSMIDTTDIGNLQTITASAPYGENCVTVGDYVCDTYPIPYSGVSPNTGFLYCATGCGLPVYNPNCISYTNDIPY